MHIGYLRPVPVDPDMRIQLERLLPFDCKAWFIDNICDGGKYPQLTNMLTVAENDTIYAADFIDFAPDHNIGRLIDNALYARKVSFHLIAEDKLLIIKQISIDILPDT